MGFLAGTLKTAFRPDSVIEMQAFLVTLTSKAEISYVNHHRSPADQDDQTRSHGPRSPRRGIIRGAAPFEDCRYQECVGIPMNSVGHVGNTSGLLNIDASVDEL